MKTNILVSSCDPQPLSHLYLWSWQILPLVLPITKNWLSACVEVRWRLFPFTIWSQGFRSGHQVWWQVPPLVSCSHGSGTVGTQVGAVLPPKMTGLCTVFLLLPSAFSQIEPCFIASLFPNPVPSVFCPLSFHSWSNPLKTAYFLA